MKLNIFSLNVFLEEKEDHINFINKNKYDVVFLSECSANIIDKLDNYHGFINKSHCRYTYVGINKNANVEIINTFISIKGIVIAHIKYNNQEIVLGGMHLAPFKDGVENRKKQINKIYTYICENNLYKFPQIFGGDTNMRDNEDGYFEKYDYVDSYCGDFNSSTYSTYPNRNFKHDKLKNYTFNNFRYDRFYLKNCSNDDYKIITNLPSDHYGISIELVI